jgi:dihydrofolate reductase
MPAPSAAAGLTQKTAPREPEDFRYGRPPEEILFTSRANSPTIAEIPGGKLMRKAIFGAASSLDNFIARPDGSLDWLVWSDDAMAIMKDFWPRIDTIVMGRKTYDVALREAEPETKGKRTKNPYGDLKTFVFSKTLTPGEADGVTITSEDPGQFIRKLKNREGKDICIMGGGEMGKTLLEAGVIDEVGLNIHPVLLGSGVPMFHGMSRQIDLELIECRKLSTGCVYVLYNVQVR